MSEAKGRIRGMGKRLTDSEARKIMIAAGLKPLVPYESSSTPWISQCQKCKRTVSPNLNSVSSKGTSCRYCSGNLVHPDDALKLMKDSRLKPLTNFPGASRPWKSICLVCKRTVSPSYKSVRTNGGGCKYCGREKARLSNRTNESEAIKVMKSVGLIPLEPYTSSNKPWRARCKKCKKVVTPRYSLVKSRGSGCAYCAETRVNSQDAIRIFKAAKLKPLIPYPGNKIPWKSIHIPCGREVSPSYLAIKRGQGPCKYCAGKAVHPRDAKALFLENDLKPLEPYSGDSKKPWPSIHIPCGNKVSPTYNIIQRGESMGCHHCSDQFVDPDEAYQFFLSKDLEPLVPFPGTAKPWKSVHLLCGEVIQPRYGHIKSGRKGCPVCAKMVPITQERAFLFFRSRGLEPQEPFKGPHHSWKSIHRECGKIVSPRWASVQQGQNGCKYCAGAAVDAADAEALFEKHGLKILEPFPGGTKPWRSIHINCGREVSPRYSGLRAGQGPCRYCAGTFVDSKEAIELFRSRGLEPLTEYPGAKQGWSSIHLVCGRKVSPSYGYVKRGGVGCNFCSGLEPISPTDAKKLFISRGFQPLEPYKNSKTPVTAIHKVCGKEVSPTYGSMKAGRGCKYCSIGGINLLAPAFLYLMTHSELGAHKIGIGGFESSMNRIQQHRKHGWKFFKSLNFETAELAYETEQQILNWVRTDLGLPQYLGIEQMPQGGHTETIDASEIELATIWAKVEQLSRVKK